MKAVPRATRAPLPNSSACGACQGRSGAHHGALARRAPGRLETIRGKRGISNAASKITRATAMPRVLVSSRRYLVRRAAVTRIGGPRFREIASSFGSAPFEGKHEDPIQSADPASRMPTVSEWWVDELLRMRPELLAYAKRRLSFDSGAASDIVDGVALELLQRRSSEPSGQWLDKALNGDNRMLFRALVRRIVTRRVQDQIRSYYRKVHAGYGLMIEHAAESASTQGPEHALDVREMVWMLQKRLEELPPKDREFLLQGASDEPRSEPWSGAERARLHRLRRKLAQLLKEDLDL
jgi:DNA-directed RNA polymerase specialized sigma24 family protein